VALIGAAGFQFRTLPALRNAAALALQRQYGDCKGPPPFARRRHL